MPELTQIIVAVIAVVVIFLAGLWLARQIEKAIADNQLLTQEQKRNEH